MSTSQHQIQPDDRPSPFLKSRVHFFEPDGGCDGMCVGYERSEWRMSHLVEHVLRWLPDFALSPDELKSYDSSNGVEFLMRAAATMYEQQDASSRGDFGEVLLHICLRQEFNSTPVVRKFYFKTAANDNVKGFDAVHIVQRGGDTELWLGEAKFYNNASSAIRSAIQSLSEHSGTDYLRKEFLFVSNKIPADHPYKKALDVLLDIDTSLDEVFQSICYPVMITYDSSVVKSHSAVADDYLAAFEAEIKTQYKSFKQKFSDAGLPPVRFHLFLIPLKSKAELAEALDTRLRGLRGY